MLWDNLFNFIKVGGLANKGVHIPGVDLGGRSVIDKGQGRAVIVGDSLAGAGLNIVADFSATVSVTQHVDIAVVETGEDDGFFLDILISYSKFLQSNYPACHTILNRLTTKLWNK